MIKKSPAFIVKRFRIQAASAVPNVTRLSMIKRSNLKTIKRK